MTKEELQRENEDLKKQVKRLKEENRDLELRYNSVKVELGLRYCELAQITQQSFDLSQITEQFSDLSQITQQGQ